jgi:acyl transferase domain-containing protein
LDLAAENAPDERVFAGTLDACRALGREPGTQPLRVLGPWHARTMASAAPALAGALQGRIGERRCAFVTATTGRLENDPDAIATALVAGLTTPVRFTRALSAARGATEHFVAPCPGRLMRSLVRRNLELGARLLDDVADLDAATRALR